MNAVAIFSITTARGRKIYEDKFPAAYLIGYELVEENPSQKKQEEVICRRVKEFFLERNFKAPAIAIKETFEPDFSEKAI